MLFMKTVLAFSLIVAGMLTLSSSVNAQTTIFSDLSPNGGWGVDRDEYGDEVSVSGANWRVTSMQIEIYSQGTFPNGGGIGPGFADFQASLYANNGPQGKPGTLLWQSAFVPYNYPAGLSLLTYAVPNVAVPGQFTWALQYTNYSNPIAPPALPLANAPTIGTVNSGWFAGPADWGQTTDYYMAQIIAVPEPGPGIVLLGGALALLFIRSSAFRCRKN
jgi:hypothetical protein